MFCLKTNYINFDEEVRCTLELQDFRDFNDVYRSRLTKTLRVLKTGISKYVTNVIKS